MSAFDIETTNDTAIRQSFVYHWQFQLGFDFTVTGRTLQEAVYFFDTLNMYLQQQGVNLVCWVHNLSFEFQFLAGVHHYTKNDVMCMDTRKVAKASWGNVEMRCSYIQTGVSFDKLCKDYQVSHRKLSGEDFDYRKYRLPITPLSPLEKEYCLNDVRGLVEAMHKRMKERGDDVYTIPMTKTGYVRREAKKALEYLQSRATEVQQDFETYKQLRRAFRGGNTHANRFFAGDIIENVKSADRVSSYPEVMLNCEFPCGRWYNVPECDFLQEYHSGEEALLFDIRIYNLRLKDPLWGFPYISLAKCRHVVKPLLDNGRIIECEYLETTLTDIDFQILLQEYDFDYIPFNIKKSHYELLPSQLRALVLKFFHEKTTLKDVQGREEDYALAKENLNSLYGMMVQDPAKISIIWEEEFKEDEQTAEECYNYFIKHSPLLYCWGVWVTAWARLRLEEGLQLAGCQGVYTDTDSVKYVGEIDFSEFNSRMEWLSRGNNGVATDPKGKTHILGLFEQEETSTEFITYGAKKYAALKENGKLVLTIAGVNKKKGSEELKSVGGLKALKLGYIFHKAGGTTSVYNDDVQPFKHNGVLVTRNIFIEDSTYTLGLTSDYLKIIEISKTQYRKLKQRLKESELIR